VTATLAVLSIKPNDLNGLLRHSTGARDNEDRPGGNRRRFGGSVNSGAWGTFAGAGPVFAERAGPARTRSYRPDFDKESARLGEAKTAIRMNFAPKSDAFHSKTTAFQPKTTARLRRRTRTG
jgi:hypothetical protein